MKDPGSCPEDGVPELPTRQPTSVLLKQFAAIIKQSDDRDDSAPEQFICAHSYNPEFRDIARLGLALRREVRKKED